MSCLLKATFKTLNTNTLMIMKRLLYTALLFTVTPCIAQVDTISNYTISISPSVDKMDSENQKVILILRGFLNTKNNSLSENTYWLRTDFDRYVYPYADIYKIESSRRGANYFKPSLMELVPISDDEKLLKLAFIGVDPNTSETAIRCIYNIVAVKSNGDWMLKRATGHYTREWHTKKVNSITYKYPKGKSINTNEIDNQAADIESICRFFDISPIPITYYSCYSPKQVFEVKGFDYLPNMFFSKTGGMADKGNIIYSGNNSEYYTHEIVHIYIEKLFTNTHSLLNEGIATYIGGSGTFNYEWHRQQFATYMDTASIDLAKHINPYEKLYAANDETLVPYMIGALICERTYRIYGKAKLFELLNTGDDLWSKLKLVGLTPQNITKEIMNELKLKPQLYNK